MAAQLAFASDYMEGAHPAILKKLAETNLIKSAGYGLDEYSETARKRFGRPAMHRRQRCIFWWEERRPMPR